MFTIVHLSDLHFGRVAHSTIVESLVSSVREQSPNLIAVSGDLTQRAYPRQFRQARELLEALPSPVIVVPGNHDVYPWWRPLARITRPLARYDQWIGQHAQTAFADEKVAVLGLNSAHGWTVDGGKLPAEAGERIEQFFAPHSTEVFRTLVVHHHLLELATVGRRGVVRGTEKLLPRVANAHIDLILCGHLHRTRVEQHVLPPTNAPVLVCSAGTAVSDRGRREERGVNRYNLIRIFPEEIHVVPHRFEEKHGQFSPGFGCRFDRTRRFRNREN